VIVIGGSYREECATPAWDRIFGSGGRAAAAISQLSPGTELHTYAFTGWADDVRESMAAFQVSSHVREINEEITFTYFHPLSQSNMFPLHPAQCAPIEVTGDNVIRFGMVEGESIVNAKTAIFDPQTHTSISFRNNGSNASRLGIVLNEIELINGTGQVEVEIAASSLIQSENADALVVKQGVSGATVFERGVRAVSIPAYRSDRVFKIGSGDVFTAVFAHYWGECNLSAVEAVNLASKSVCHYVNTRNLPIPPISEIICGLPLKKSTEPRRIYIAAPFFDIGQRWVVEEALRCLVACGANVFSPLHDIGTNFEPKEISSKDIEGLLSCSAVFAILNGGDPGTIFEIGYARSHNIPVVVLAENINPTDATMFDGSGCEIVGDFASAIYRVIWATWR